MPGRKLRKTDGMFGGDPWPNNLEHAIPDDDFKHIKSMDCGCIPYVHTLPGIVGPAICHTRIVAEEAPDTLPDGWT